MKIPNNQFQTRQANRGDLLGEISESFNIDLTTNYGKIKLSERLKRVLAETTNIGTPASICDLILWNATYHLVTEDGVYVCSASSDPTVTANWSVESGIADLDLETTAAPFNGLLLFSLDNNILSWNGSVDVTNYWTTTLSGSALTAGVPHVLHNHKGGQETLFVTDGSVVRYYNTTAGHSTVTLQSDLTACCVDSGVSAVWVGTFNENSGNAFVYEMYVGEEVDGTPVARQAYEVDGLAVLALWVKDNVPHIVTERGNIQAFNGAGFTTIAQFPFAYNRNPLSGVNPGLIQTSNASRPIHPRGVKVHNGSTYILISTQENDGGFPVDSRSHSGIWELTPDNNLYHRFATSNASNEYGASLLISSGPILIVDNEYTFLLAGTESEVGELGLYATFNEANQGWFVTAEDNSGSVQGAYELYHKAKTLGASESIVTQYRKSKRDTVQGTAYWVEANQFNTTDDWSNVSENELVRISHGYGAGEYANITNINRDSNTVTVVTLDRSIGSAGETSYVYSDNFVKAEDTYTADDGEFKHIGLDVTAPWIQVMVIMKGQIEYRMLDLYDKTKNER